MSTILNGESVIEPSSPEQRVWELAVRLRDSGLVDLSGNRQRYGDLLHELEKHQDFLDADLRAHPDTPHVEGLLSAQETEVLTSLRRSFPSEEDRLWLSQYSKGREY